MFLHAMRGIHGQFEQAGKGPAMTWLREQCEGSPPASAGDGLDRDSGGR